MSWFEYLESKIVDDNYTDDEYETYIEIKASGSKALSSSYVKKTINKIKKEYEDYYDGGRS